ncbi:hypothetical protein FB45DRAFT_1033011 [Roridomyces roridus]|uniref:Uncharacterized protein n=1 Tax=Roridomyces roridus TaxID=1738132 RepID=A0AAD7BGV4_9AGAR|nr:hypothetical protein FB45DRAFT_1033011 [Roridomyces roridus]
MLKLFQSLAGRIWPGAGSGGQMHTYELEDLPPSTIRFYGTSDGLQAFVAPPGVQAPQKIIPKPPKLSAKPSLVQRTTRTSHRSRPYVNPRNSSSPAPSDPAAVAPRLKYDDDQISTSSAGHGIMPSPYMREIRGHAQRTNNALLLGPLHRRLSAHLETLIQNPGLLLDSDASWETATLDTVDAKVSEIHGMNEFT